MHLRYMMAKLMPLSLLLTLINTSVSFAENCPFTLDSHLEQGTAVFGSLKDGYLISLDGKNIPLNEDGRFIIGIGRDYGKKAVFTVYNTENNKKTQYSVKVKKGKWHIERVNGVEPKKVTPPAEFTNRIVAEAKIIKEARKELNTLHFPYRFIAPLKGRISGVFGSQRIFNGKKRSPHSGNDIAALNGTPVAAVESGKVVVAYPDMYYNGNVVIIDHGFYVNTTYAHLSEINVKVGDMVKKGDIIGKVGSTGRSTGNHLHLTLNVFGVNVRPDSIIPVGGTIQDKKEYEKKQSIKTPAPQKKESISSTANAEISKQLNSEQNQTSESKVYRIYNDYVKKYFSDGAKKPVNP